jgi:glycosyltransferase involved in cell wall biosynthesis
MKTAYLLKTFPKLSETFILNEILGLEKLGMEIEIFSLKHPEDERRHPAVSGVKGRVAYVRSLKPKPVRTIVTLFHHLVVFLRNPANYRRALRFYLREQKAVRMKEFMQAGVLARALRRRRVEHLHAHFANVPTTIAEIVRVLCDIPYSFTAHAKDIYLTPAEELQRKIAGAEFVLTCTGFNREHLRRIARSGTPIRLAYHGVDLRRFTPAPAPPGEPEVPVIMSVGRFCEKKGFPDLIHACAILKREGRRFRCRIVGYGELRDKLAGLIVELGLEDCVSLEGPMTQDQVIGVYRSATVFVLPCFVTDSGDRDGIPNVLLEAMSMRVPVISTGISGISELVEHMVNGILVPERDPGMVANAVALLLDEPQLRARLAENGRSRVIERFALENSARRVFEAFQELRCGTGSDAGETKEAVAC